MKKINTYNSGKLILPYPYNREANKRYEKCIYCSSVMIAYHEKGGFSIEDYGEIIDYCPSCGWWFQGISLSIADNVWGGHDSFCSGKLHELTTTDADLFNNEIVYFLKRKRVNLEDLSIKKVVDLIRDIYSDFGYNFISQHSTEKASLNHICLMQNSKSDMVALGVKNDGKSTKIQHLKDFMGLLKKNNLAHGVYVNTHDFEEEVKQFNKEINHETDLYLGLVNGNTLVDALDEVNSEISPFEVLKKMIDFAPTIYQDIGDFPMVELENYPDKAFLPYREGSIAQSIWFKDTLNKVIRTGNLNLTQPKPLQRSKILQFLDTCPKDSNIEFLYTYTYDGTNKFGRGVTWFVEEVVPHDRLSFCWGVIDRIDDSFIYLKNINDKKYAENGKMLSSEFTTAENPYGWKNHEMKNFLSFEEKIPLDRIVHLCEKNSSYLNWIRNNE